MKQIYKLCKLLVYSGFIYALLLGCKKSDNSDPDPTPALISCKLATSPDNGGATYTYTPDGQFNKITYRTGEREEYAYNASGYVTTQKYILADNTIFFTSTYEFANNRMATITTKYSNGSTNTLSLEYDGNGEIKRTVNIVQGTNNYTEIINFDSGKQIGYTFRYASGDEGPKYIFENGRVKSDVTDGSGLYRTNYEYDAQGRRTRDESLVSGKVVNYTTYEYTEGKGVREAMPTLKGLPKGWRWGLNNGSYGLPIKINYYNTASTGSIYLSREATSSYSKNASGFPLVETFMSKSYNSNGTVRGSADGVSTYTYIDCP